ncbi:UDP-glycosyltransferase [Zunongwangia sp. F260]|uniref:UDP-glycosyltransferase n=1 Tax=Autumnicola lenta TaxID=3075593 RepID=A0ABU3CG36_9FLAO|nr:UDP-glycosyltransferase [Zunongwangia sp. F260]MDT0645321.1 UDP-glycosyltransferase [Zunongwangia sp. F260]
MRKKLEISERKSVFYQNCREVLDREKPDFIFCTNQRPVHAISPLTAAKDLGIPTSTFIFSWDNLPKATMVVESDFYFVWSDHMKQELLKYYPHITSEQILITGSPQFEHHYDKNLIKPRITFFEENNIDLYKDYICFSGDDITTSPDDAQYLQDVAESIKNLNKKRDIKLGILFRRCPVDFSDRYDKVLEKYKGIIVPVAPKWNKIGNNWNTVLPNPEDLGLQINTILHSKAVVNLGSSMVFDFAIFGKPCLFIAYNVDQKRVENWSVEKVYDFVHLRNIPTGNEVVWLKSKEDIGSQIETVLQNPEKTVAAAKNWFEKINFPPGAKASERIWMQINNIGKIKSSV